MISDLLIDKKKVKKSFSQKVDNINKEVKHFFTECTKYDKKFKIDFDSIEIIKMSLNQEFQIYDNKRRLLWHVKQVSCVPNIINEGLTVSN